MQDQTHLCLFVFAFLRITQSLLYTECLFVRLLVRFGTFAIKHASIFMGKFILFNNFTVPNSIPCSVSSRFCLQNNFVPFVWKSAHTFGTYIADKIHKSDNSNNTHSKAVFLNLFLPQHPFWSSLSSPAPPTIG